jgi:outer membrane immunogenic protein
MFRHHIAFAFLGLSIGFSVAAFAADLGVPSPAPVYTKASPPESWTWTGFYLGADAGGAWGRDVVSPTAPDGGVFPRSNTLSGSGFFGGGTFGYNFQTGPWVFGVESDLGYLGIGKSVPDPQAGITEVDAINSTFYADVTGRLGYAVDRFLIYGKGGWAVFDGTGQTTTTLSGVDITNTGTFNGWTAGGGVEYKITPAWSVKAEYLHFDFGSGTATIANNPAGTVFGYKNDLTADTVKAGINYRFW